MNNIFRITLIALLSLMTIGLSAQTKVDFRKKTAELTGKIQDYKQLIEVAEKELALVQTDFNTGKWVYGVHGLFAYDWNNSKGWFTNPDPNSKSKALNIALNAFINKDNDKTFWHNKAVTTTKWLDVDLTGDTEEDKLFDQAIVDIVNISSLGGYKVTEKFAISAMGELNSSVSNFLDPGTLDLGIGATWLPIKNMTVSVFPLNYHFLFTKGNNLNFGENLSTLGAKARVDYFLDIPIYGKTLNWTTTLSAFIPYGSQNEIRGLDGAAFTPELGNYTWLNSLSVEIWKGIGVGFGWGLRKAKVENGGDFQRFTNFGLSFGF